MEEDQQFRIGHYCQTLMEDQQFNELVELCVKQFSLEMLEKTTTEEREETYYTYQGLRRFVELMQQFVIAKDQIAARSEQEDKKEDE